MSNFQIGGHVGTRKSGPTAVCVNCGTDREPHVFYYTRNCQLAVAVCEPCAGEYTYDVCVNCHKQTEITDLTEGPTYKHFAGVKTYFPSCDPCFEEGIEAVEREVREHVEGVTTAKTITREEFERMQATNRTSGKRLTAATLRDMQDQINDLKERTMQEIGYKSHVPPSVLRVIQDFHVTAPYTVRVELTDAQGKAFNRSVVQVVGYAPNPDVGTLEAQILDTTGMVMSISEWADETATRTGHEDSGYRFDVEVISR